MKNLVLLTITSLLAIVFAISAFFVVKWCGNSEDRLDSLTEKVESIDLSALDEKPQEQPVAAQIPADDDDVIVLGEIDLDETFGEAVAPQSSGGNNAAAPAAPQQSGGDSAGSSEGILHYNGSGEIATPILIMD